MELAITSYTERGRLGQVARLLKDIAEIFEKSREIGQAIDYYQRAADAAEADNKKQDKLKSLLKIATLCSSGEGGEECDFHKAAEIFEGMGHEGMESKLGAYAAKGYFFQAALCLMASGDNVAAGKKLASFKQADFNFPSSRECLFVEQLLEAMENFNAEDFAQACADFDRITPLDPWKTSVLVKIKRHLVDVEAEENEDDLT
jgi:alpha-soluble NSF attachment protein